VACTGRAVKVLAGRLGLAVFAIGKDSLRRNSAPPPDLGIATRAAVFRVKALATAAGRGTGRGTMAVARGGMSLERSAARLVSRIDKRPRWKPSYFRMAYVAVLLDRVDSSDTDIVKRSSLGRGVTSRTFDDNSNGEPSVETVSFAMHQRGSAAASAHVES
jgi:hypothetical protein